MLKLNPKRPTRTEAVDLVDDLLESCLFYQEHKDSKHAADAYRAMVVRVVAAIMNEKS